MSRTQVLLSRLPIRFVPISTTNEDNQTIEGGDTSDLTIKKVSLATSCWCFRRGFQMGKAEDDFLLPSLPLFQSLIFEVSWGRLVTPKQRLFWKGHLALL